MKSKFSSIWRVAIALVLVLSFSLVMAAPVAAQTHLDEVTITVSPPTGTATAQYQVDFYVHTGLTYNVNCFVIEFPTGTTVPGTILNTDVEVYDITAASGAKDASDVVVDTLVTKPGMAYRVRVYMPAGPVGTSAIMAFHYGRVVFELGAGIENPAATDVETFCAWVYSDEEPPPEQVCYNIYETVPIDVFLKYQIKPVECGYVEDILVDSFLTIGGALDFVDDLYTSGETAVFDVKGTVHNTTDPWYGEMDTGTWTKNPAAHANPIEDTLSATTITTTDTADETFTVYYNESDGTATVSKILTIASNGTPTWEGTAATDVVDVVSVTGGDPGDTAGYQAKFNLTGDAWNATAGDYGDWGITTASTFTDGTSIGEAFTVDVTTSPAANPETYKVTYISDDASGTHYANLTILTDDTEVWSPAMPTNIVDIQFEKQLLPAWAWYEACPTDGGLIGARVLVKNGTYFETITIGTPGVMFESVNGALETIIDAANLTPAGYATSKHAAAVMIAAEGVTFGGIGKGFTVKNAGVGIDAGGVGDASVLWADDNSDGIADVSGVYIWPNFGAHSLKAGSHWCRVNVIGNIIYGSQARGIRADASGYSFAGGYDIGGVCVYVGENTVYDNLFDGFSGDHLTSGPTWLDPGYTFTLEGGLGGYTAIVNNEFYQNGGTGMGTWEYEGSFTQVPGGWKDAGIEIGSTIVFESYEPPGKTCYIVGNDIHDNVHSGINLLTSAAVDALVIKKNAIYDNGIFGISNSATTTSGSPAVINVDCRHNDIYGNGYWGIKNFVEADFPAKENYWGALGGPSRGSAPIRHELPDQRSLALGNGDAVSHYVTYNPWLSVSFVTVVGEGIRYYGSDTLTLQAGWNTLSVPLSLHTSADTLAEIKDDLGSFLTVTNWADAYQYNPVTPGWETPTTLVPGRGYYIKMVSASRFPVLYSNQLGLPAFVLDNSPPGFPGTPTPGWYLIGSAFGIDRVGEVGSVINEGDWAVALPPDVNDEEAEMNVGTALNSIGAQASVVVSPSVPGQLGDPWSEIWSTTTTNHMCTGEAYWVFMKSSGTLAGWEITPFYFTPPAIP